MTSLGHRIRLAIAGALLVAGSSTAAHAQQSIWKFTGNCIDCADAFELPSYTAKATLTLNGYLGGALSNSHFVSFVYDGSNLIDEYLVNAQNFEGMTGNLTGSPQTFAISFGQRGFFALGMGGSGGGDGELQLENALASAGEWATCPDSDVPVESAFSCEFLMPADFGNNGAFALQNNPISTVPEPGTYALMAMGLGALTVVTRRRRRA